METIPCPKCGKPAQYGIDDNFPQGGDWFWYECPEGHEGHVHSNYVDELMEEMFGEPEE